MILRNYLTMVDATIEGVNKISPNSKFVIKVIMEDSYDHVEEYEFNPEEWEKYGKFIVAGLKTYATIERERIACWASLAIGYNGEMHDITNYVPEFNGCYYDDPTFYVDSIFYIDAIGEKHTVKVDYEYGVAEIDEFENPDWDEEPDMSVFGDNLDYTIPINVPSSEEINTNNKPDMVFINDNDFRILIFALCGQTISDLTKEEMVECLPLIKDIKSAIDNATEPELYPFFDRTGSARKVLIPYESEPSAESFYKRLYAIQVYRCTDERTYIRFNSMEELESYLK